MKLWDIVKKVGGGLIRDVVPGGGLLVDAVNAFLPDDSKLPPTATGSDVDAAVASLPADQRAEVMGKEFDVELTQIKETNETLRVMLESDARNPHSTRPKIVMGAFRVVAFISLLFVSMWAYAVLTDNAELVKAITDGWPFAAAIILPFVGWLDRYFGKLTTEHKNRLNAASGETSSPGIAGILSAILKR